jgi:hypothetical protein
MNRRPFATAALALSLVVQGCAAETIEKTESRTFPVVENSEDVRDLGTLTLGDETDENSGVLTYLDYLSEYDLAFDNGSYFEVLTFYCDGACAQQPALHVSLSADFDTILLVQRPNTEIEPNDDDPIANADPANAGRGLITDSFVQLQPELGAYFVYATSYAAGEVGRYRLEVALAHEILDPNDRWNVELIDLTLAENLVRSDDAEIYCEFAVENVTDPDITATDTVSWDEAS